MNANEPVAWISENDLMNICHKHPPVSRDKILDDDIPLYSEGFVRQQQAEIEALKAKDLKKSMAIRSLNIQLKKALQYETFNR